MVSTQVLKQMKNFKDLKVWQKAHELALLIYKITSKFPMEEKFGLCVQMRRAAVSVASNIAEGFTRHFVKVSANFYNIADGSLEELRYQLILSRDLGYISLNDFNCAESLSEEVSKMLHAWIGKQG